MRKLLAFLGVMLGGYIGFLNRPSALFIGQLPFTKIILAGTNLQGLDKLFVPVARTSFRYMVTSATIGLLGGLILGTVLIWMQKD
jgi:hypothetical protein